MSVFTDSLRLSRYFLISFYCLVLGACGGSGDDSDAPAPAASLSTTSQPVTGYFAGISGLSYEVMTDGAPAAAPVTQEGAPPDSDPEATSRPDAGNPDEAAVSGMATVAANTARTVELAGTVGPDGAFQYLPGRQIRFFHDGVAVGSATVKPLMSLFDLRTDGDDVGGDMAGGAGAGNSDTTLINQTRYLMAFDSDGRNDDGIALEPALSTGYQVGPAAAPSATMAAAITGTTAGTNPGSNPESNIASKPASNASSATALAATSTAERIAAGETIDFSLSEEAFEASAAVRRKLDTGQGRQLPASDLAQELMGKRLLKFSGAAPAGRQMRGVFGVVPVQGLAYSSGRFSGKTDDRGGFDYEEGHPVNFRIGAIDLGTAPALPRMNEFNLARSLDSERTLINLVRFLQAIDDDAQPANGIQITDRAFDAANGKSLDFVQDWRAFEQNPRTVLAVSDITRSTRAGMRGMGDQYAAALFFFSRFDEQLLAPYDFAFTPTSVYDGTTYRQPFDDAFSTYSGLRPGGGFRLYPDEIFSAPENGQGFGLIQNGVLTYEATTSRSEMITWIAGPIDPIDNAFRGRFNRRYLTYTGKEIRASSTGTFVARMREAE